MTEAVSQTLIWVNEELASTLAEARQSLENYLERPENTAPLKTCADLMHEASGALMMVEVQGGSLLAEEVEKVARRLLDAPTDPQTRGEALEALSRAMVQLPSYMERVVNGGRDIPLILLPLLNDLRAVRGQALLSENTLLLLNLPAERRVELQRPRDAAPSGADARTLARQSRPRFQAALLGWIRGDRPDSSLAVMADVVGSLEDASASDRSYQIWWVSGGVIEALRQNGLDANAAIKRLLGQVDFELRRLADEGERALESNPPVALLNSLLFYVARSSTRGRRVAAIRQCFSLGDLVPPDEELESARDSLSAPSVRLMQTVGGAIRDDLSRVKDVLDIFVRTGLSQIDELAPQVDLLRKIGDTMGVLGLAGLKDVVHEQSVILQAIVDGDRAAEEDTLLEVAGHLIEVEDNLERQLVGMVTEGPDAPEDAEDLEALESRRDFDGVTTTVLRECNVNLGRVKEAIVQSLDAPLEAQMLDEVPQLLRAITAGLLMLDRARAVALVERIGSQIRDWLSIGDGAPSDDVLDRLADAIVSLEYFMETIAGGRSDPMYMLDNAEACLEALDELARRRGDAVAAVPEPTGEAAATLVIESPFAPQAAPADVVPPDATVIDIGTAFGPPPETPEPAAPRVGPDAGQVDPELLELFIEEARELAAELSQRFPEWSGAPENEAPLADIRRLFHTIKGSGRMVGAELIGEFAWRVENLLNRVINRTIEPTQGLIAFVGEAIERVPALVEQLETGQTPAEDPLPMMERADAWVEGRAADAAPAPGEMDPVLRDIFAKEAGEHLGAIRRYLADCAERAAPYPITEELYRACHTLAGSANMAGVEPAVTLARPLDRLVRSLNDDGAGMSPEILALCESAAERFDRIVEAVREGGRADVDVDVAELAAALQHEQEEHALRADAADAEGEAPAAESPAVEPEPAPEPVRVAPAEPPPALDLDPEIAEIFREEADEILERCDEVVELWRGNPKAREPLDELQRQLHTLKGGARLAGLTTMGDLSHALEDLVTRMLQDPGAAARDGELVQRSIDELHRMRDGIDQGHAIPASPDLVAALTGEAVASEPSAPAADVAPTLADEVAAAAHPADAEEASEALALAEDDAEPAVDFVLMEADEPPPEIPLTGTAEAGDEVAPEKDEEPALDFELTGAGESVAEDLPAAADEARDELVLAKDAGPALDFELTAADESAAEDLSRAADEARDESVLAEGAGPALDFELTPADETPAEIVLTGEDEASRTVVMSAEDTEAVPAPADEPAPEPVMGDEPAAEAPVLEDDDAGRTVVLAEEDFASPVDFVSDEADEPLAEAPVLEDDDAGRTVVLAEEDVASPVDFLLDEDDEASRTVVLTDEDAGAAVDIGLTASDAISPADLLAADGEPATAEGGEPPALDFDLTVGDVAAEATVVLSDEAVPPAVADGATDDDAAASATPPLHRASPRPWTFGPPPASATQLRAVTRLPTPKEPAADEFDAEVFGTDFTIDELAGAAPFADEHAAAGADDEPAVDDTATAAPAGVVDEPRVNDEVAAEDATGEETPSEPVVAADAAAEDAAAPEKAPAAKPPQESAPAASPSPVIGIPAAAAPGATPAPPSIAASSPALGGRAEIARVDADLLENLLNNAGEVSIYRSRLEQQVGSIEFNLDELSQTVARLRDQLRKLEMESDVQALHGQPAVTPERSGFDSLEMDRYSMIQQLTRALAETASDVSSLQHSLDDLTRDAGTLLTQQQRVISELQDGLMRTRMVPFSRHVQRLNRIVRQAAREADKQAELQVVGGENELDRQVMDRMLGPFEHLLRNAIVHGIESPEARAEHDKPAAGRVGIELRRDGAEMRIVVSDDGRGLDLEAIERKAESLGFIEEGERIDDETAAEMIFRPGFSTAIKLTLVAGRGVGMDVVANEIRELGGSLRVESEAGKGLRFVIRLPYTRAITQALVLRSGEELFALPLPTVEGIARVRATEIGRHLGDDAEPFEYGGHNYQVRHLASLIGGQARPLPADDSYVPLVLVRAGEHSSALLGDEMLGAREIVVKTLGPQFASVPGIAGATILGDGSIVIILDVGALVRVDYPVPEDVAPPAEEESRDGRTFVMVVDDSITVRRVTERLLERNGMQVITAKDGVDAVSLLREHRPDIILLDIEMPRMDGYEVAHHIRNDPRLRQIPIVMITSRVGQKHRARAMESGVNDYLGKPYQENQLLAAIGALVDERRIAGGG